MKNWLTLLFLFLSHSLNAQDTLSIKDMIDGPLKNFHQLSTISKLNKIGFSNLPLKGNVSSHYDYGYQWYNFMGGINRRTSPSKLSPAEKLNRIITKKYKTKKTLNFWAGLCNGVANLHAVANLPTKDIHINKENKTIVLTPKDTHAIASLAMNKIAKSQSIFGKRCNSGFLNQKRECHAVNPAIFHILLASQLGLKRAPIIVDAERYKKVNNLPVYEYSSEITNISNANYQNENILVYKVLTYITLPKYVSFKEGTLRNKTEQVRYEYELYIDDEDTIIGGIWASKKRPDFVWLPTCKRFKGEFEFLNNILEWKC